MHKHTSIHHGMHSTPVLCILSPFFICLHGPTYLTVESSCVQAPDVWHPRGDFLLTQAQVPVLHEPSCTHCSLQQLQDTY